MSSPAVSRVQKYRVRLREKGLKPIQIWMPDTHKRGFAAKCKRQALRAKQSDFEQAINDFIAHSADHRGWEWE